MGGNLYQNCCQGPHAQRCVVRDGDMVLIRAPVRQPDVDAGLPRNHIPETFKRLDEFAAGKVAW